MINVYKDSLTYKIFTKLVSLIVITLIFGYMFTFFNDKDDWAFTEKDAQMTYSNGIYFSVVTLSTVGYGDITPKSIRVRYVSYMLIVLGLIVFIM